MTGASKNDKQLLLSSDNPITSVEEDTVGRLSMADSFIDSILNYDASRGLVVGLMGPWGSGKSSFINLSRVCLKERLIDVIDFNPWFFSNTNQLAEYFFKELSSQLRLKGKNFEKIAGIVEKYSGLLSPIAILPGMGWWERLLKITGKFTKLRYDGVEKRRAEVTKALKKLNSPIVVMVDDIDRLSTTEIREVFKLVRLTANFPNIIYLLAFDRQRVECALDESGVPGRAYIEKILQVMYDLPEMPKSVSRDQTFKELNKIMNDIPESAFDQDRWADVYFEIIEPNITTIRDVKRYALSANITINMLKSDVDIVDVLALEAIRIFQPSLYFKIKQSVNVLAERSGSVLDDDDKNQRMIDNLIAGDDEEYIKCVIRRIFPVARKYVDSTRYDYSYVNEWRRGGRVAHEDNLNTYLEHLPTEGLRIVKMANTAYDIMDDLTKFSKFVEDISPSDLEGFIQSLEAYEGEYKKEQVAPASIVLMNNIYRIPEKKHRSMFDITRPDIIAGRVVLRMLRSIKDGDERESVAKKILPQLESYSTQLDFIELIGHKEGLGHKLVSKDLAESLHSDLIKKVYSQRPIRFEKEWQLLRSYYIVASEKGDEYIPFKISKLSEGRKLLQNAYAETRSQTSGSRVVKITPELQWNALVKIIGSEKVLRTIVTKLKKKDGDTPLITLAEKYLDGWRPSYDNE
mgnify:FL=1